MEHLYFNLTDIIDYRNGKPAMRYFPIYYLDPIIGHTKAYFCLPTNMCFDENHRSSAFIISRRGDNMIEGKKTFTVKREALSTNKSLEDILVQYENALGYLSTNEKYINYPHYSQDNYKSTVRLMHAAGLPHIGTVHLHLYQPLGENSKRISAHFRHCGKAYNTYLGKPTNKEKIREKMRDFIVKHRHMKDIIDLGCMELLGISNPNDWWNDIK